MTGNTMEGEPGLFYPQIMMGQRDLQIFALYGQLKNAGALDFPLFPTNGIPALIAAIGTDTVTGTAAPFTHTVNTGNTLNSYTIEKNIGGFESLQFSGSKCNKMTLKCQTTNSEANITTDWIAKHVSVLSTPTAVSMINEFPFIFAEGTLNMFGNSMINCSNIQLTIENNIKDTFTFNQSHELQFLTPTGRKVNGTLDVVFDSLDDAQAGYFNLMLAHTSGALNLTFTHPTAPNYSVALSMPTTRLGKYADTLKMDAVIMSALTFEAEYNLTNPTLTATIINGQSVTY